jgi:hypothetical protein
LHALSLAYVLSSFEVIRRACAARVAGPFALLGRHALPVFATISLLNFAMQLVRVSTGKEFWTDTAMIAGGMVIVFALAAVRQAWPRTEGRG